MTAQFFTLLMQVDEIKNAWELGEVIDQEGNEILSSNFTTGQIFPVDAAKKLSVVHKRCELPVDFQMTFLGVPIVSKALGTTIANLDGQNIQRIPVTVAPSHEGYEILNIINKLDCLDYEHTQVDRYTESWVRPDKRGKTRSLSNITIKASLAEKHHIFRLAAWHVIVIVSNELKTVIDDKGFTGLSFSPVNVT